MYLRMRSSRILYTLVPLLRHCDQLKRFARLTSNILLHDLSQGIPFPDNSVDVIFHLNMREHLDRPSIEDLFGPVG